MASDAMTDGDVARLAYEVDQSYRNGASLPTSWPFWESAPRFTRRAAVADVVQARSGRTDFAWFPTEEGRQQDLFLAVVSALSPVEVVQGG